MDTERLDLQRTADQLGLPWTNAMSDDKLRGMIDEHQGANAMPEENLPPCHGLLWEAVGDSPCVKCTVKTSCLKQFASVRIPMLLEELGGSPTLEELSKAAGAAEEDGIPLRPEAMLVALDFSKALREHDDLPSGNVAEAWDAGETTEQESEQPAEPEPRRKKKPPTQEEPVAAKKAKAKKKAPVKKKASSKAKKKTKKTSSKRKPVENPLKAGPAKRAKVSASSKGMGKKKSAPAAQAQQSDGQKDWMARWLRERKRSPQIGRLTPGCVVRREYPQRSGVIHDVKVLKGKYEDQSKHYPTL